MYYNLHVNINLIEHISFNLINFFVCTRIYQKKKKKNVLRKKSLKSNKPKSENINFFFLLKLIRWNAIISTVLYS